MELVNRMSKTLAPFMKENALNPPDGGPGICAGDVEYESKAVRAARRQAEFANKMINSVNMAHITINPKVIPSPCHAVTCGMHSVNSAETSPY